MPEDDADPEGVAAAGRGLGIGTGWAAEEVPDAAPEAAADMGIFSI